MPEQRTCAVCGKPLRGNPMALSPKHYPPNSFAHWNCWRLHKQRVKWNRPEATELGQAKRLHEAEVHKVRPTTPPFF